jgi:hypothetical protein
MAETEVMSGNVRELLKRACQGDESCRQAVRALFADDDRGRPYLEGLGSSAEWLIRTIIRKAAGDNIASQEAIRRMIESVRAELAGPNPSPMERLLAERVALCWWLVNWYENSVQDCDRMSIAQANFFQARIDKAHSRFLKAIKTLAQVRKLALPALQVNIARNQLNVTETRP